MGSDWVISHTPASRVRGGTPGAPRQLGFPWGCYFPVELWFYSENLYACGFYGITKEKCVILQTSITVCEIMLSPVIDDYYE